MGIFNKKSNNNDDENNEVLDSTAMINHQSDYERENSAALNDLKLIGRIKEYEPSPPSKHENN